MLLLSLLALISSGKALATCVGDSWTAPAGLWGDPHITTWNQVYQHFQGDVNLNGPADDGTGRPLQVLYYLITNCDADNTQNPPYRMLGSFVQYGAGPMSVMDYVALELFDDADGDTYYVILTPGRWVNENTNPVHKVFSKNTNGATPDLRYNNRNGITKVQGLGLGDNPISGKFSINLSGNLDTDFDVVLTISSLEGTTCTLEFNIRLGETPNNQYRWNYITVQPPSVDCGRCDVCGIFGDFRTPLHDSKLLQCDGETYKDYTTNWGPSLIEFEGPGWTYEYNTYGTDCIAAVETCEDAYLSDITPESQQAGWGTTNDGVNEWIGYTTMEMGDGSTYEKFLVVHPNHAGHATAYRTYPLDGNYERLTAVVGSAQTTNGCVDTFGAYGSFSIEILVDGEQKYYRDGYGRDGYDNIDIDLTGAAQITIKTLPDGDWSCDHPAIANPLLTCAGEPIVECPAELYAQIETEAQLQLDALKICCRNLGGRYCARLIDGAIDDICIEKQQDDTLCVEDLLKEYFTEIVESECKNRGKFGPVPRLLYDFQNGAFTESEVISDGNPQYDLQAVGAANIQNGILRCDGTDDYVYSVNNFDFEVLGDHSLEVLVAIENLASVGGGAIAIDGNYRQSDGNYHHDQFDSIVFNELSSGKWILGSNHFTRTKDTTGNLVQSANPETQANIYLQMIAVYNEADNVAKLYRNGQEVLSYVPHGGFMSSPADADGDQGIRIMFCQRHLGAGLADFPGRIRYGAFYDYALTDEDVSILYDTGIVNIGGVAYENVGDELKPNGILTEGQALVSCNGEYAAVMQTDGQFRVYNLNDGSSTCITNGAIVAETSYLAFQGTDGNIVVYTGVGTGYSFAAMKFFNNPTFLIMQGDGNLVAYATDDVGLIAYWDSQGHTAHGPVRPSGKADLFGFDSFDGFGTESTTSYMSYLIYLVGILLITNIICLTVYCLRKKDNKRRKYKVVSIDSSDAEEVNLK